MLDIAASLSAIEARLAAGESGQALAEMAQLLEASPMGATANGVIKLAATLPESLRRPAKRLFFLRSTTIEPAFALLQAWAEIYGQPFECTAGEFNAWQQEVILPQSPLWEYRPDGIVIAVHTRSIAPKIWDGSASNEERLGFGAEIAATFADLLSTIRARTAAPVVIHNFELPPHEALGIAASSSGRSFRAAVATGNQALREVAAQYADVWVLDYDGEVANFGRENWWDLKRWHSVRMACSAGALPMLAKAWLRYLLPAFGRSAKVAVVDLDNTLWGGVVGEDGVEGLQLDDNLKGHGHRELQRVLLGLKERGILLALASKNNPEDALEVIEGHARMLLRKQDFSSIRIGWQDKAQSLREIATELNVGADAMVFIDDNPAERAVVRQELPEVYCIELPKASLQYGELVAACPLFERLQLSADDQVKTEQYAAQAKRRTAQQETTSIEDFYRSLEQVVSIEAVSEPMAARVKELTTKTNQFNLTTKRYQRAEVDAMLEDDKWLVLALRVEDRFGDNGIVALAMAKIEAQGATIDTFLMSCRVIGRTVEDAMMALVVAKLCERGTVTLRAEYLPTAKNSQVASLFERFGMKCIAEGDGAKRYSATLADVRAEFPEWIKLKEEGA